MAIGVVGDAGVRANAQQPKLFVGMILILIFAEVISRPSPVLFFRAVSSRTNSFLVRPRKLCHEQHMRAAECMATTQRAPPRTAVTPLPLSPAGPRPLRPHRGHHSRLQGRNVGARGLMEPPPFSCPSRPRRCDRSGPDERDPPEYAPGPRKTLPVGPRKGGERLLGL